MSSPRSLASASFPSATGASNTANAAFLFLSISCPPPVVLPDVQPFPLSVNTSGLRSSKTSRSPSLSTLALPAFVLGTTSIFSPSNLSREAAISAIVSGLPRLALDAGILNLPVGHVDTQHTQDAHSVSHTFWNDQGF